MIAKRSLWLCLILGAAAGAAQPRVVPPSRSVEGLWRAAKGSPEAPVLSATDVTKKDPAAASPADAHSDAKAKSPAHSEDSLDRHEPALRFNCNGYVLELRYVPRGSFLMGDAHEQGEAHERPAHEVWLHGFYIGQTEIPWGLWTNITAWALAHGYDFTDTHEQGPPVGRAPDHPVCNVSWYDAVKWCNALSEFCGRTPIYYTDATRATVYRRGQLDLPAEAVRWDADGFRLPTEAEWEKAARGGLRQHHFPWPSKGGHYSDHIDGSLANFWQSGDPFDAHLDLGTTPVGYYNGHQTPPGPDTANGYGLYDVAGNVAEWCWDWYDDQWYAQPAARGPDPKGPDQSWARVLRGGSWINHPKFCRVAARYVSAPHYRCSCYGLRVALSAP